MKANGEWEDYINLKNKLAMVRGEDDEPLKDYTDISLKLVTHVIMSQHIESRDQSATYCITLRFDKCIVVCRLHTLVKWTLVHQRKSLK